MTRNLISRAAAVVASSAVAAVLFGAGASAKPTKQHICSPLNDVCVDIEEFPNGQLPGGNNRFVTFYSAFKSDHFNIRTANGAQIEACASCGWGFFAKPGASYTFSVQDCRQALPVTSSHCGEWQVFHYTNVPTLEVIAVPAPAGPTKKLGRVEGQSTTAPLPICVAARAARARNSPAASGLEAQCSAALKQQVTAVPGTEENADPHVLKDSAGGQGADLSFVSLSGPGNLQAGLSGTYKLIIKNAGNVGANVELAILFSKALNQTGQIVPGAGLACGPVGHGAAINDQINCTGGQLAAGETGTVIVQARGQVAGAGTLVGTLNNSRSVQESNYNNNVKQLNVTIN